MANLSCTPHTINAFFSTCLIERMSCPTIDLAEACIDHFECAHNINLVAKIHTMACNYIAAHYPNIKTRTKCG